MVIFFENLSNIRQNSEIVWFSIDIGLLAGNITLGYSIQLNIGPMIKTHKNQEKNSTVIAFVYLIGGFIYCVIAVLGSLGIEGRSK